MAIQRLSPNSLSTVTVWPNNVAAIQDDPDSPDGNWLTAATATSPGAEIQFQEPTDQLIGTSEFRVLVRLVGGDPATITITVKNNGVVFATPVSNQSVTSKTGQIFSFTVNNSSFTNNGMNAAIEITTVGAGGSPAKRSAVELGAVEWNATVAETVIKSASDTIALSVLDPGVPSELFPLPGTDGASIRVEERASIVPYVVPVASGTEVVKYLGNTHSNGRRPFLSTPLASGTNLYQYVDDTSQSLQYVEIGDPFGYIYLDPQTPPVAHWYDPMFGLDFDGQSITGTQGVRMRIGGSTLFGWAGYEYRARLFVYDNMLDMWTLLGSSPTWRYVEYDDLGVQTYAMDLDVDITTPHTISASEELVLVVDMRESIASAFGNAPELTTYVDQTSYVTLTIGGGGPEITDVRVSDSLGVLVNETSDGAGGPPAEPADPIAGSDAATLSVSETSSIELVGIGLSAADSGAISVAETSGIVETAVKSATDSSAISVTETTSNNVTDFTPQYSRPDGTGTVVGVWTGSHLDIDEVVPDDIDFLASSTNPAVEDYYTVTLSTLQAPLAGNHTIRFRYAKDADAGRDIALDVQLRQGDGTIIHSENVGILTSSTFTQREYTLTPAEVALITDYEDLRFRFVPTASGGGAGRAFRVSWLELEVPPGDPATPIQKVASDSAAISVADRQVFNIPGQRNIQINPSFEGDPPPYTISGLNTATWTSEIVSVPDAYDGSKVFRITVTAPGNIRIYFGESFGLDWNYDYVLGGAAMRQIAGSTFKLFRPGTGFSVEQTSAKSSSIGSATASTNWGFWYARTAWKTNHSDKNYGQVYIGFDAVEAGDVFEIDALYSTFMPDTSSVSYDPVIAGAEPIAGSDSSALTVSETSSLVINDNVSGTEVVSVSVIETIAVSKDISSDDSISIGVSDVPVISSMLPGVENSALAVFEQAAISVVRAGSDSTNISIADASSRLSASSRTDSVSIGVTESNAITKTLLSTDTAALSVSETSSTGGERLVPGADGATLGIAESRTINTSSTRTDSAPLSVFETATIFTTRSSTDQAGITVTDTSLTTKNIIASDQAALSVTEVSNIGSTLPGVDSAAIGVAETRTINAILSRTDTASLAAAEARVLSAQSTRTDAVAIGVIETTSLSKTIVSSDTLGISVSEAASTGGESLVPGSDGGAFGLAEQTSTSSIGITSDAASLALSETRQIAVSQQRVDSIGLAVSDAALVEKRFGSADSTALAVTEISSLGSTLPGVDSNAIGVAESVTINVTTSASDSSAIAVSEFRASAITTSASDSAALSVSENTVRNKTIASVDSLVVGVGENGSMGGESLVPGSDTASVGVVESRSIAVFTTRVDQAAVGVSESTGFFINATKSAADSSALAVADNSNVFTDRLGADSAGFIVTETSSIVIGGGLDQASADTSAIGLTETTSLSISLTRADQTSVSVSESTIRNKEISSDDSSGLRVTEGSSNFAQKTAFDNHEITLIDISNISSTSASSDNLSVGLTEASSIEIFVSTPGADLGFVAVTETSDVEVRGTVVIQSADTAFIQADEHSSVAVIGITNVSSDQAGLHVSESVSFSNDGVADDTSGLHVSEASVIYKDFYASDTVAVIVDDISDADVREGFLVVNSSDGITIRFKDFARRWNLGGKNIPVTFDTNSHHGTIISSAAKHTGIRFGGSTERDKRF